MIGTEGLTALSDPLVTSKPPTAFAKKGNDGSHWGGSKLGYTPLR